VGASASLTQANQTLAAAATLPSVGNAGLTQADGVLTAAAVAAIAAAAGLTQANQTLTASASTGGDINASAVLTQDDFSLLADGTTPFIAPPPPEVTGAPGGVWRAGRRGGRGSGLVLRRLKKKIETLEEQLQELRVEQGEATPWVEAFPDVPAIAREEAASEPDLAARIHAIAAKLEAARAELARIEEEEEMAALLLLHLH